MKITHIIPKNIKRYYKKNTINAQYEKSADLALLSTATLAVQIARFPSWQYFDVGIVAGAVTLTIRSLLNCISSKADLKPIIKRAKNIAKYSKH